MFTYKLNKDWLSV